MQQVEGGNPVNLAPLKGEAVADFNETGDQRRFEIRICDVFAGGVVAFGRRAEEGAAAGEGLHLLPHGHDGPAVAAGETRGRQAAQFSGQFGVLLTVDLLPSGTVLTLVAA